MARYVVLSTWTQQGIADFEDTVGRYEAARNQFEGMGVSFKEIYWTLGNYDMVNIVEAPDDATLAAALLKVGSLGNLRTVTLRALSADEMSSAIAQTG
jgi:uncharacterized protein with GYD domain